MAAALQRNVGQQVVNSTRILGLLILFSFPLLSVYAQPVSKADAHWCSTIPAFPALQEAVFSAVYVFDLSESGKPVNIRRASVPFISKKDEPLIACIASWRVRSTAGKGTATFQFHWGWTGLDVASGSFHAAIPAQAQQPDPQQPN